MIKTIFGSSFKRGDIFPVEEEKADVSNIVAEIIGEVRKNGDAALIEYSKRFDKADLNAIEVTKEEIDAALALVEDEYIRILKKARNNIESYHKRQLRTNYIISEEEGKIFGQKIIAMEKVGLYVPGGTAAYPSTVLMNSVPAKLAGVSELIMVTPPAKDGSVNPVILAAAKIGGVDRVFKVGGAQAVAALAFGTETVPKVDKIVGPGNVFVQEAKKQVFGKVAIDMIAGPSEILIITDGSWDARIAAADMLSQAEHDRNSSAVLITTSEDFGKEVALELERQLGLLPREEIARESIDKNGRIIIVNSIEEAVSAANEIAPEHLELCVDNPFDYLDSIRHAGSVFLGKNCPEALGDYLAGTNHVLPTLGTARFSSPLSVDDFVKKYSFTYYTEKALEKDAEDIAYFAEKEGLSAHARSALARSAYKKED